MSEQFVAALSACNVAIVRSSNEAELFEKLPYHGRIWWNENGVVDAALGAGIRRNGELPC